MGTTKKTALLPILLLLAASLPVFSQSSDSQYQTEWLMFHNYVNHTGIAASSAPVNASLAWYYRTNAGSSASAMSAVISNGVVYFGSPEGGFYALNITLGTKIWNYSSSQITHSAAIADGVVYVPSATPARVYALNASTGALKWEYAPLGGYPTHLTVANGFVYFCSNDGTVYSLNASSGGLNWSYATGGASYHSSPAIVNGILYVGTNSQKMFALNASDGTEIWNYTTETEISSSPAVANGVVYFGTSIPANKTFALNATTGEEIGNYTTGSVVVSSPAVAYDKIFTGSFDGKVYALNASNVSQKIWDYDTGDAIFASPAIASGMVFIGSRSNRFYALNATSGGVVWSYLTGGDVDGSPAVADGMVFVVSRDGNLYAFAPGLLFWQGDLAGQLNVSQTCGSEINATALNFGSLVPGQTSSQQSLLLTNLGSWNTSDITLEGTDWISTPTVNFTANYTKWSNVTGFAYPDGNSASNSPLSMNFNLTNNQTQDLFFRVQIPLGQATAAYSQNITLTTIC